MPHFLGIGAQRAGTSWLYENLANHPDIWMPYKKELHYFDRAESYASPSYLSSNNLFYRIFNNRLLAGKYWRRFFKNYLIEEINSVRNYISNGVKRPDLKRMSWRVKYLFGICNDSWYASLFEEGTGKVTGEITPSYSILELDDIKHIREIMPELKLIFIMRNPVDRAWSHAKHDFLRKFHRSLHSISEDEFIAFFNSKGSLLRSDYLRTVKNWRAYFPKEQFFIGFFDEIISKPESFLSKLFDFLRVDKEYKTKNIRRRINVTTSMELSVNLKRYLAKLYYFQIKKLSKMFGSYPALWLSEAEKIL